MPIDYKDLLTSAVAVDDAKMVAFHDPVTGKPVGLISVSALRALVSPTDIIGALNTRVDALAAALATNELVDADQAISIQAQGAGIQDNLIAIANINQSAATTTEPATGPQVITLATGWGHANQQALSDAYAGSTGLEAPNVVPEAVKAVAATMGLSGGAPAAVYKGQFKTFHCRDPAGQAWVAFSGTFGLPVAAVYTYR